MQRFWWPGYEMQLLEQLQRQQHSAQFCDTVLQSEGISVPIHSCVLAALSPYLYQRLSESPSPPLGQKRQLHLQEVTSQTLLKLVGLLYSGQLEVKSRKEQNDVLAAAYKFGISDLLLGFKGEQRNSGEILEPRRWVHTGDGTESRKSVDTYVQTETTGRTDKDSLGERKSFVLVGTQTSLASPGPPYRSLEVESSGATCSTSLQTENVTQFSLAPYPALQSNPESTAVQSSEYSTSSHTESLLTFLRYEATSQRSHEKDVPKGPSESGEGVSDKLRPGEKDGDGENPAQLHGVSGETTTEKEMEERSSRVIRRGKNLEKMKLREQTMDTATTSVKVKLRRTTKGAKWKILGDAVETVLVPSTLKQCFSNEKTLEVLQIPANPNAPVLNPEVQRMQPVSTSSPLTLKRVNSSSESEARSNDWLSMNQSSQLGSDILSPPRSPTEESDGKMDKLLENFIMGMNLLPDLASKKTNHDGVPTFCQVPAAESSTGPTSLHADVCSGGCVLYRDLERQGQGGPSDTGFHYCFGAQNHPNYAEPSVVNTGLQQHPPEFSLTRRPFGRMNGLSWTGEVTSFSSGQKRPYLQPFSQEDPNIEFLHLPDESEAQPVDELSLPYVDDLRLPQCLSPFEPCPADAQQQPRPCVPAQPENCTQPSVKTPPWLSETAATLQFPLNAIGAGEIAPQLLATGSDAEVPQRCMLLKLKNDEGADSVKGTRGRETKSKPEWKFDTIKRKQNKVYAGEDAAPPKRKRRMRTVSQKRSESLAPDYSELRYASKKICCVSLSCNNVLMKQTGKTTCKASTVTTAGTATPMEASSLSTERTRIKTRGFVKRSQENTSNTLSDKRCVLIPVLRKAVVVQNQEPGPPRRKRGRPRKIKLEILPEVAADQAEVKGHEETEKEAPKKQVKCKALVSSASEEDVRQLKETGSAECLFKNKSDNMKITEAQKQSWMVTLQQFQKLIKRKHSKTRKGTEIKDGNKSTDADDLDKMCKQEAGNDSYPQVETDTNSGSATTRPQKHPDATVDKNHNLLPNSSAAVYKAAQQDVTPSSEFAKIKPTSFCDVLDEEIDRLLPETEQSATSPDPGVNCSSSLSGCTGKEEDEDEDVDVMLYSPDESSSARDPEERVLVIPDEEEEEEVVEIDVTGDEAE